MLEFGAFGRLYTGRSIIFTSNGMLSALFQPPAQPATD